MGGPFHKDLTQYGRDGYRIDYGSRTWSTQPKANRSHPLPYRYHLCTSRVAVNTSDRSDFVDAANCYATTAAASGDGLQTPRAYDKAYGKLIEQINETSDVANEALFKVSESMDLIEHRALQLARAAKALRKGHLKDFKQALGLPGSGPPRINPKDFADVWLEYHFGWTNLMNDIYRACQVAGSHYPVKRLTGRGSDIRDYSVVTFDEPGWLRTDNRHSEVHVRVSAKFVMTNFIAHTLQQYGLANPAAIVWALTPFSFVVDWFVDVQSYLLGATDFIGLDLKDPYVTYFDLAHDIENNQFFGQNPETLHWDVPLGVKVIASFACDCERDTGGISPPSLTPKRITGISPVRAATAISLLLQFL